MNNCVICEHPVGHDNHSTMHRDIDRCVAKLRQDVASLRKALGNKVGENARLRLKLVEIPVAIAHYEAQGGAIHPQMKQTILDLAAIEEQERAKEYNDEP